MAHQFAEIMFTAGVKAAQEHTRSRAQYERFTRSAGPNDELSKQVGDMIEDLKKKKERIRSQEEELDSRKDIITSLEAKLEAKDEVINVLKSRTIGEGEVFVEDPDRPSMETVFIDPTEQGKHKLKSHINVEDVAITAKEEVDEKINKLKNLIGSVKK